MTDAATLRAELEALKGARRSGVYRVRIGEREAFFRGDAELRAQIAALEAELAGAAGAPKPSTVIVRGNKGFL